MMIHKINNKIPRHHSRHNDNHAYGRQYKNMTAHVETQTDSDTL